MEKQDDDWHCPRPAYGGAKKSPIAAKKNPLLVQRVNKSERLL